MVNKIDYVDFQRRTQPLAYLITFRCYGTWLHGDERGSVNRRNRNIFGQPGLPASKKLVELEKADLKSPAVTLDEPERRIVEKAIREVCRHRAYTLFAINVRTNHVHSVVRARCKPEHVMDSFKAYATRQLRKTGLLTRDATPWARHGSTLYLWTDEQVQSAVDYVRNGQADQPFDPRRTSKSRVALAYARAMDT